MDGYKELVSAAARIEAPVRKVWEIVTTDTGTMFMGSKVVTDWQVGSPITFRGEWKGRAYVDRGEVRGVRRERLVAFTHYSAMSGRADRPENYSLVSIRMEPEGDGTDVTVTQSMPGAAETPDGESVEDCEANWRTMLGRLKDRAEGAGSGFGS